MTLLAEASTRNGNDVASPSAALPNPAWSARAPAQLEGDTTSGVPPSAVTHDVNKADEMRRHALWFFWMWLLFATVVSIGGNVIHAWMTAPAPHLKVLAAIAAAVPPAVLLGSTHSVALLIKTRRRGYRRVDAVVLGAALLLMAGVAVCAFAMSFFSLRDLMILLGMSHDTARLWPIGVDISLICSTLALLSLTPPQVGADTVEAWADTAMAGSPAVSAVNTGPRSQAERRLWWESVAAVVRDQNSEMRKIAELPCAQLAEILERLYDNGESKRAVGADHELHHREVRAIAQSADDVLTRLAAVPSR
ncbi:MAG: DUF2637 domain-containing protein [Actinomycetota bacterium]|nr:DUF2637 domain-containing protein [Actinomycetota bacterium]